MNEQHLRLFEFNLNQAWKNNCLELHMKDAQGKKSLCGKCDTCQIKVQLNSLKPWLLHSNHSQLLKFLLKLIRSIRTQTKILEYLNNLLTPLLLDAKDLVYSRNSKIKPSLNRDCLKISQKNNENIPLSDELNDCITWYLQSNYFVKLNFLINLFQKCDYSILYMCNLKINKILEQTLHAVTTSARGYLSQSSMSSSEDDFSNSKNSSYIEQLTDRTQYDFSGNDSSDSDSLVYKIDRRSKYIDFIRQLPVYLSKAILSSLNKKFLKSCTLVSKYWYNLVKEIVKDSNLNQVLVDDMMILRACKTLNNINVKEKPVKLLSSDKSKPIIFIHGTTSKICNPKYANDVDVQVPNLIQNSYKVQIRDGQRPIEQKTKSDFTWAIAYSGIVTRFVIMEERNVFCGSYNVLLLKEKRDAHRVAHLNGSNIVTYTSLDKKIRFIDLKTASDKKLTIQGHAASIRCMYINEDENYVLTGSYDTSIRCWNLTTGRCMKIYQGHQSTVTCMAVCDNKIVTGSYDRTCRVWSLRNKKDCTIFKHKYPIVSVAVNYDICVSGGLQGKIKVFLISSQVCLKSIQAHKGLVSGIKLDKWHIVTCGTDGYALGFSTQGKHDKCLVAMRHPKAVTCIEYQYLRVITGSSDGKIRIWNLLNGDCLRVMRGNSQCDPIYSLSTFDNKILINTEFNLILMEFERIKYEYGSKREIDAGDEQENEAKNLRTPSSTSFKRPHSQIRASRMQLTCVSNAKLFNHNRKSAFSLSNASVGDTVLNEARCVQQHSRPSTSKISIITLNTPITNHNHSALSYINVQSVVNETPISLNEDDYAKKIDYDQLNDEKISKDMNLNETKRFLRSQLRFLKQIGQERSPSDPLNHNKIDTKSCVEAALVSKMTTFKGITDLNSFTRPSSSPSRYDTHSKLKYYSREIEQFLSKHGPGKEEFTDMSNDPISSALPVSPRKASHRIRSAISKQFKTQTLTLDTNTHMHPKNITSKLPNPQIVTTTRPATAAACYEKNIRPNENIIGKKEATKADIKREVRCKSAFLPKKELQLIENYATNKILAKDDLKLMTHKEIDRFVVKMSQLDKQFKLDKQKEDDEICKKAWLLKSTGHFHGSLLEATKPKFKAPEIRE